MTDFSSSADASVVAAVATRQSDALEELYRRFGGIVFSLSLRLLHDRHSAEEVTQDIFVRLWNEPGRFDPERGSLRSFLCAQAHSRSVDLLRAESARRERQQREISNREPVASLETVVENVMVAEQLREIVASLPDGERRAIELAYYQGLTYVEVARQLEEPEGTVKSRIRSGLRTLHERLSRVGYSQGEIAP